MTENVGLLIDGVRVGGRRSSFINSNMRKQIQISYTTNALVAGDHELALTWSVDSGTLVTCSQDGSPARHEQPRGYFGYAPAVHIREFVL